MIDARCSILDARSAHPPERARTIGQSRNSSIERRASSIRFRQENCLHTTVSYAIVPLPLPLGRGVFFVMSEIRESKCCWRSSMVEQLICNQQVAGSIPIASSNGEFYSEAGVAEWLKAADCKSAGILPTVVRTHPPAPLSYVGE